MADTQEHPKRQALAAWLAESVKLQVFFIRVLTEAREQRVDRIQFTIDGETLLGSLRRGSSEVKTLNVKAAWFEPMARWLFDRCAYAWSNESGLPLRFPQEQMESHFPVLLRVGAEYARCCVGQRLVLNRKHVLTLSELEFCTRESILERLDLLRAQTEELSSVCDSDPGMFIVGGPEDAQTLRVRATYLSLLGGHAAGPAVDALALPDLTELCRGGQLIATRSGTDAWTVARQCLAERNFEHVRGFIFTGYLPRVCQGCKRDAQIPGPVLAELPEGLARRIGATYSLGSGCAECAQAGTLGLCAVTSMLLLNPSRRAHLADADGLRALHHDLVLPMQEDGVYKIISGKITPSQLLSLVKNVPAPYLPLINEFRAGSAERDEGAPSLTLPDDVFKGAKATPQALSGRAAFTGSVSDTQVDGPLFSLGASGKIREKPMVLVVEDDPDQRNILEVLLRSSAYEVRSAGNGREALDQVSKELPDLIVTDLMMPQMDGAELIARVRADAHARRVPILVLTVLSDSEKEYALLDIGADDYCEKTIQRKVLLKRIEKLVRRDAEMGARALR